MVVQASHWGTVSDVQGQLFEGARWIPDLHRFQWVDILGASLHRWDPSRDEVESRSLDLEFVTCALPMDADRQLVASRDLVGVYSWETDTFSQLDRVDLPADVRFNDGGVSPSGDLYVGTMSMAHRPGVSHLYRLVDGRLSVVLGDVGISNGLGWYDEHTALYVDSLAREVSTLALVDGVVGGRARLISFEAPDEPDGLTIGPDGSAYLAIWRGARVVRFNPRSGMVLENLPVPATYPTSVAVGGGKVLVTTAAHSEPGVSRGPLDGSVLILDALRLADADAGGFHD